MDLSIRGFLTSLDALGVPMFALDPGNVYPSGWQRSDAANNAREIAKARSTRGINGLFGGRVAVLDIDTKNGAEVLLVRASLAAAGVQVYAEVQSPGPGWHFYMSATPGMPTLHANRQRASLDFAGVEVLAVGANAYLPGTERVKYNGAGYTVVRNDLDKLLDDDGTAFAAWVAAHTVKPKPGPGASTTYRAPAGGDLDPYVERALNTELERVATCTTGGRNDQLNTSAFALGQLVAGGVLDGARTENDLLDAARACGLGETEARRTIDSGMRAGAQHPRGIPERTQRTWTRREAPMGDVPPDVDPETGEVFEDADNVDSITDRVFGATPLLSTIRQAAHSRLVVPWAVLGAALARVVAEVPPHIVLPPIIGKDASLNLAVALVAESGGGKSGATGCAADVLRITHRHASDIGPGSGEGLIMAFLDWDAESKSNVLKEHPLALLQADEIGQIGAVQARASQSTFASMVRAMLTGGFVATSAADETRRRKLNPNTYRLAVVAGVQPRLADVLLDEADAGTPQRWLWLPADDPNWSVESIPEWPGVTAWEFPRNLPPCDIATGRVRIPVPDEVVQTVIAARVAAIRRETDGMDGHRLLTQEKVAAALALLHGECAITLDWWELARLIMLVSDRTRERCQAALAAKALAEHKARGRMDAVRESGAREARSDETERYAPLIHRELAKGVCTKHKHTDEEGHTRVCLTFALRRHRAKVDVDAAIELAESADWITKGDDGRWRLGASRPMEAVA